ncbi:hypothetical protein DSM106972_062940 [Dulcicalothrix desertica PCC 7102]|uniref:Uncharacterized protein n=1 Tax=Dulcicalothrix desertica PCC 7102 TaxID=232991 RepID=A0A433V882_9CYAN|nr:hypothetical protein [Dulcicalothrix desertica]RUT02219.1 hypothetical protein DSM106972_062940 [Dulcicalothrix desertica PCC 7102]TWH53858.1 hypothetical protein CAL7102_01849 [Dulcicalothrix desertica PCC 7102]
MAYNIKVQNNYDGHVSVKRDYNKGSFTSSDVLGCATVEIGDKDSLRFVDIGDKPLGPGKATWGVVITSRSSVWVFRYEGGGVIELLINPDGTFSLKGNGGLDKI